MDYIIAIAPYGGPIGKNIIRLCTCIYCIFNASIAILNFEMECACLAPPDVFSHVHVDVPQWVWVWVSLVASLPQPNRDWWFLNKGPCPVYCSGRGRHYVGGDVVIESGIA